MSAPKMNVDCSVENCTYNKERMCYAQKLEVNALVGHRAETSDATSCVTFKDGNS
jgi:hypothetical protein